MKQIELTQQEANNLIALINIAIKAGGLEVAETGVFLHKKIQAAFAEKPVEKPAEEAAK